MRRFNTGKVSTEVLVKNVFRYRGKRDRAVLLGSSIGEDAAVVRIGREVLVLTTDPISSTASDVGWLSVFVNANDVACRGARPRWFLCDLLLPKGSNAATVNSIMKDIDKAARTVGVAVVGGHTEVTPGLDRPIVVGYMVGTAKRNEFVTTGGARPGDVIIMTKTAGLEGTAVLALDFSAKLTRRLGSKMVARARRLRRFLSVIDDALIAVKHGRVHALHDPTEGGLLQGLWEVAEASRVGFLIEESRIPILAETRQVCSVLRVKPLRLMSSGCLLIAVGKRHADSVLRRLKSNGIAATLIGHITPRKSGRKMIRLNGTVQEIRPYERDEIYRVIETQSKFR